MPADTVRRGHLGKTEHLDALAHAAGQVSTRTLVFFWRTGRHQGIWLTPKHLMRLIPTDPNHLLHAQSVDAAVQAFFASLKRWRERRQTEPTARPPRRRTWSFNIEDKPSAMSLKDGKRRLSNGKGNDPLWRDWPWELPQTVVIHWTGEQDEAIAPDTLSGPEQPGKEEASLQERQGKHRAGIDLGDVHLAVSHDGRHTHLLNGRLVRAKRHWQNTLKEHLSKTMDRTQKGSRRRKKRLTSKKKQLARITNQIKDIEHQHTTHLLPTLSEEGVQTVVIGDVKPIRQRMDGGATHHQKLHQWSHGHTRHLLTSKAERLGMGVVM